MFRPMEQRQDVLLSRTCPFSLCRLMHRSLRVNEFGGRGPQFLKRCERVGLEPTWISVAGGVGPPAVPELEGEHAELRSDCRSHVGYATAAQRAALGWEPTRPRLLEDLDLIEP